MAQPAWQGGRGGSRGKRRFAWSGRGSRVWTPASAPSASRTAGAPTPAPAPARLAPAATPTAATAVAPAPAPTSAQTTPALTARTSSRKAAELVQIASDKSAAEIEGHLKEVEDRLAVVIAQEEEVRVIADEHLERESHLTKLLEDLYRQQKEEQEGPSPAGASSLASSARPRLEVAEVASASGEDRPAAAAAPALPALAAASSLASGARPCLEVAEAVSASGDDRPAAPVVPVSAPASASTTAAAASAAAATAGPTVREAVSQPLPRPDASSSLPQPARQATVTAAGTPAGAPAPAAKPPPSTESGSGSSAPARRRHASSSSPRASSSAVAAAAGGKDTDPSLVLAMAMGCGVIPGGDDLLTRDADTIAEYIGLMSHEALAEEAGPAAPAERWRQAGLSLKVSLDRAEATAACPARMPNLLALAEAIRPLNGVVFAGAAATAAERASVAAGLPPSGGSNKKSMKRKGGAGIMPWVNDISPVFPPLKTAVGESRKTDSPIFPPVKTAAVATETADGQAKETEAPGLKRRRMDVSAILCPFELNGVCNDDDCRYQHLDIYLRKPSEKPSTSLPSDAATTPNTNSPLAKVSDPRAPGREPARSTATGLPAAAGSVPEETVLQSKRQQLPPIEFNGEREPPRQGAPGGDRGSGRGGAKPPPKPSEKMAVSPAAQGSGDDGGGGGGADASEEGGESGEETTSVDGEADFLALPTESAECQCCESGGAAAEGERAAEAAAEGPSPAVLANTFARAASGDSTKGSHGRGGGRGATGAGSNSSGGLEARYYFEDASGKAQGAAVTALTGDKMNVLETQLKKEDKSCDVEGWLLLALHRLPRSGDSATAVLNTVGDVARGASGPMGKLDQAAIKPALRTFVQPLEMAEGGQAEALWLLYLRLFAFLPGKADDTLGMAEHALEKFPTSRRLWRLYRSMLQKSPGWSLTKETSCYSRQLEALLLLRSQATAAAMQPQPQSGSGSAGSISTGAGEIEPGKAERGGGADGKVEMVIYLVLERCCLLTESGYKLQAAAELLDALGVLAEGQPLWGWDSADEQGRRTVLRTPLGRDSDGGSSGIPGGASAAGDDQRLPPGVAIAVKEAPRETRCVLWLTALHLLLTGVFPLHALLLAEHGGGGGGSGSDHNVGAETDPREDTRDLAHLLLWPKEWLSSKGSSGLEPPVNADLQEVIFKTFMNALSDAELLPPKNRGGQGWAPPTKDRDALLSSALEAKTARSRGLAPDPSALEGTPLVLALNWLTFCRGSVDARQGRMMAVACCRRFQLARPDHPALLEHFLLEHQISKARTLDDIYDEISRAFDPEGVASEAVRERREAAEGERDPNPTTADGGRGESSVPPLPSEERLQAVYTFLRFVEMRLKAAESNSAAPAGRDTVEAAQRVLRRALVGMWTGAPAGVPNARSSDPREWLEKEGDEPARKAVEGAKASLFCWADGASGSEAELSARTSSRRPFVRRPRRDVPGRNGDRQLSTIVFSLWVLGGASAAIGALDHLLSAESFSSMSAERRRLLWLQRLGAAVVLSAQQAQAPGEASLQAVREVALRALADHRTHRRAEYSTLADFVASTLDRPVVRSCSTRDYGDQSGKYHLASVAAETPLASFSSDVLTVYANHFLGVRGGVDWVVAAEALERDGGVGEDGRLAALALLRWVSWADADEHVAAAAASTGGSLGVKINARPYVEKALTRHPGDPALSGAVAALDAATRWPGRAQRVLEAALRANPYCAVLWEQRIALEAGFGDGSAERAGVTAAAAASSNALVRLSCGGKIGGETPSRLQARTAGRISTTICHPSCRRETKSFSLQAALAGPAQEAAAAAAAAGTVVPRSVFLMKSLVSLSLALNGLVSIPFAIGRLPLLRVLDISGNALTALPLSLSRLSGTLRVLRAAGNKLKSPLSANPLEDLVGLRVLDLERNELCQFPGAVVRRLTELRTLKLAGNGFSERAPMGLSDALPHLEELTLPALS